MIPAYIAARPDASPFFHRGRRLEIAAVQRRKSDAAAIPWLVQRLNGFKQWPGAGNAPP